MATSVGKRKIVLRLFHEGFSFREISEKTSLSKGGCYKIIKNSIEVPKLSTRGKPRSVSSDEVVSFIEYMKKKSPSIQIKEIRAKLLEHGICTENELPSITTISRIIRDYLGMTRKIMEQVPHETTSDHHDTLVNNYMSSILTYKPEQIHFFDECSVVRTSGNRRYGHSLSGERAVEVQRYASNAKYTLNLLCNIFEIGHFEIIEGASNALEMLDFFQRSVHEKNSMGNPIFNRGDVVVMDNCGFHHHRVYEGRLRNLLNQIGVELVFQPPYSPELNACEYVFHLMKEKLRQNSEFTYDYTELAITRALTKVESRSISQIYRKCGYV
ncbi:hypothetical protein FSP39_004273 [Pinctada imbricata]|uniref:Paired domain-containing protein n=1 Tax=Pinctada imbricata TaxID=66713 RepID=A0AA88YBB5_PINIB|nr:hypothetical protein FSP39_004273 [Pinctada imbricata]